MIPSNVRFDHVVNTTYVIVFFQYCNYCNVNDFCFLFFVPLCVRATNFYCAPLQ